MSVSTLKPSVRSIIERAIARYGDNNITVAQLADAAGFTEREKAFAEASWALVFADEWFYLSDEIILGQLTSDTSKSSVAHFISRELIASDFIYGRDYARVTPDGLIFDKEGKPMTQESCEYDINFRFPTLETGRRVNGKQYYIVSPVCMKGLLLKASTKRGNETRDYFLKVERLAVIMHDFMVHTEKLRSARAIEAERTAHQLMIERANEEAKYSAEAEKIAKNEAKRLAEVARIAEEEARRATEAKSAALDEAKDAEDELALIKTREIRMRKMRFPLNPPVPDGYIYIMTKPTYEAHHIFKVGQTSEPLRQRMYGYSTGNASTDKFRYLYARECFYSKSTEYRIKEALSPYRENQAQPKSELFIKRFADLRAWVDSCIDDAERGAARFTDYWERRAEIADTLDVLPTLPTFTLSQSARDVPFAHTADEYDEDDESPGIIMPAGRATPSSEPPDEHAPCPAASSPPSDPRATVAAITTTTTTTITMKRKHKTTTPIAKDTFINLTIFSIQETLEGTRECFAIDFDVVKLLAYIRANQSYMTALNSTPSSHDYVIMKRILSFFPQYRVTACNGCDRCVKTAKRCRLLHLIYN